MIGPASAGPLRKGATMLGWITEKEAQSRGFTHRGWMFGLLPVYLADLESDEPLVAMRWEPLEYTFDFFAWLWCSTYRLVNGEPVFFNFTITGELAE